MSHAILSQINSFQIGPLTFHLYGLIVGLATAVLILCTLNKIPTKIKTHKYFWIGVLIVICFALIFARLSYVIMHVTAFQNNPIEILYIWKGGTTIFGVMLGGLIGYFITWKILRKSFPKLGFFNLLDKVLLFTPLAQSIGRWANFVNNELFGSPTNSPWGIYIPEKNRPQQYINNEKFHPAFLYESILNLISFFILKLIKRNRSLPEGYTTGIYLINYGIIRFIVERFRIDTQPILWNIKIPDILSLILILTGTAILVTIRKNAFKNKDTKKDTR